MGSMQTGTLLPGKSVTEYLISPGNRWIPAEGCIMRGSINMKKIALISCLLVFSIAPLFANGEAELDTDGWYVYQRLDNFNSIDLRMNAEITLIPGNTWEVKTRGQKKDLEDLDIYISGKSLVIRRVSLFNFLNSGDLLEIAVTMPRLDKVTLSSNGTIRTSGKFESGELELEVSGGGDMSIEAIADTVDCRLSGTGELEYLGEADRFEYRGSGTGDAELDIIANRTTISITGTGAVKLQGKTDLLEINATGSGPVRAEKMESGSCNVTLTGTGSAEVRVSRELEIKITGTGSLRYYGNPVITSMETTGTGRVRKN